MGPPFQNTKFNFIFKKNKYEKISSRNLIEIQKKTILYDHELVRKKTFYVKNFLDFLKNSLKVHLYRK